jgi:predicted PurR-regulated permease PerM
MNSSFNEKFRQVVFFLLLLGLGLLIFFQLKFLFSGFLGAVTLYILNRNILHFLTNQKNWNKYLSAGLLVLLDCLLILLPFILASYFILPKFIAFSENMNYLVEGVKEIILRINSSFNIELLSKENLNNLPALLSSFFTGFIGGALNSFLNIFFAILILFFMLLNSDYLETVLLKYIPLKETNKQQVVLETKSIVTSYAIGIPVLAVAQGLFAAFGYWLFGINDAVLWGFITCICAVIPVVGSGLIWIPLVVFLYSHGNPEEAIGLLLFCSIVVINIDNFLRLFLLKAFADIHPLITLLGVITGLKLFGFIGLIFGPLLISYLLLLIRIYSNEFNSLEE